MVRGLRVKWKWSMNIVVFRRNNFYFEIVWKYRKKGLRIILYFNLYVEFLLFNGNLVKVFRG